MKRMSDELTDSPVLRRTPHKPRAVLPDGVIE
jgi:hypothetical protein